MLTPIGKTSDDDDYGDGGVWCKPHIFRGHSTLINHVVCLTSIAFIFHHLALGTQNYAGSTWGKGEDNPIAAISVR